MAGWAAPLSVGGLWFVWPAVDSGWKVDCQSLLIRALADPAAIKKAAEAAPPTLVASGKADPVPSEDDKMLAKAMDTGDWTYFEAKWEAFAEKSGRPGEDDDEDEDDDDDDEDDDDDDDDDDEDGDDDDDDDE